MARLRSIVACLFVLACRSESPPPAPPPAPPPPPPAPPTALQQVPDAPSVLSLVRKTAKGCEWTRNNPVTKAEATVHTLAPAKDGGCGHVKTLLSPDGRRGVALQLVTRGESTDEHSPAPVDVVGVEVALDSNKVTPLPVHALDVAADGRLIEAAIRADGRVVLVSAKQFDFPGDYPKTLEFAGIPYPLPDVIHGFAAMAHAFELVDGAWKRTETKVIDDGPATATGAPTMKAFQDVGPRLSFGRDDGEAITHLDAKATPAVLKPHAERCAPEGWARLARAPELLVGYLGTESDLDAGGCLFLVDGKDATEFTPNPLDPTNATRWSLRDDLVLGTDLDGGKATLWSKTSRATIGSLDGATHVQFWAVPKP